VVDDGWPLRRAAERFQVSPTTAKRWADRYRADLTNNLEAFACYQPVPGTRRCAAVNIPEPW
jgi:uncharacterized protein YjcR